MVIAPPSGAGGQSSQEHHGAVQRGRLIRTRQAILHEGCAERKPPRSPFAPPTPTQTSAPGAGVHEGPKRTGKPASHRSRASAWRARGEPTFGVAKRTASTSSTASVRVAAVVTLRSTASRAEPSSCWLRALISPLMIRRPVDPGSRVSATETLAVPVPGHSGSVGRGGTSSRRLQESVAANRVAPAVRVAIRPPGSPGRSATVQRLAEVRRSPPTIRPEVRLLCVLSVRPAPRSGPRPGQRRGPPRRVRPPEGPRRPRRSRGRAGAALGVGS